MVTLEDPSFHGKYPRNFSFKEVDFFAFPLLLHTFFFKISTHSFFAIQNNKNNNQVTNFFFFNQF